MIPGLLMLSGAALLAGRFYLSQKHVESLGPVKVGNLLQFRSSQLVMQPAEARIKRIDEGVLGPTYEVVVERLPDGRESPDRGRTFQVSPSQVLNVTLEV